MILKMIIIEQFIIHLAKLKQLGKVIVIIHHFRFQLRVSNTVILRPQIKINRSGIMMIGSGSPRIVSHIIVGSVELRIIPQNIHITQVVICAVTQLILMISIEIDFSAEMMILLV